MVGAAIPKKQWSKQATLNEQEDYRNQKTAFGAQGPRGTESFRYMSPKL